MRKLHNSRRMIDVSDRLDDLVARLAGEEGLAAVYLYGSYDTAYQTRSATSIWPLSIAPMRPPNLVGISS